ncbi:hypothetical protein BsWGS_26139 [Bradybaena similaris]
MRNINSSGVNGNAEIYKKITLLHINASKGCTSKINSLIKAGADINAKDWNKRTPLHCSVESGHKDAAEILLNAGANVNAQSDKLVAPLHVAAYTGHIEIFTTLLKADANASAADYKKWTPLHYAACCGHAEIVETLLKADANSNAADYKKWTPLHFAACCGDAEIGETLPKADAADCKKLPPLPNFACGGHAEIVEMLLKADANANAADDKMSTPLHYAACKGNKEIVKSLLKAEANVNAENYKKRTPVHEAVDSRHTDIVEMLLKADANANAADDNKMTPLHYAVSCKHAKIVEMLLKAGANVNAECNKKMTSLHYAACRRNAEIVEMLLRAGANVNAECNTKMTPLHCAACHGHSEIVETLLKAGANVNAKCDLGHTPLFYSNRDCHHEVSECLLKSGATARQSVWKRILSRVSSALGNKTVFKIQSTKTVHVLMKSTEGISRHSEYSHTSIKTCEPRDGHTDVTPSTVFASDIYHGCSSADSVTLLSSGSTANTCTVISDDTEATTSAPPLGLSLQECEEIRNQVEDHLVKFPSLQNESHIGECCTDVASVFETGNIIIDKNVVQNNAPESLQICNTECLNVSHTELLTVNSEVNFSSTERAGDDEDTDDSDRNNIGLEDNNKDIQQGSSSADCVTLASSGRTANSCEVISDDTEGATSDLQQGLSLQEREDFRKQVEDHWARFSLQHKSNNGQCSTGVMPVLNNGSIIINYYNNSPTTINVVQKNYTQESLHIENTEFVNMNSRVNIIRRTEPPDTDDSDSNDNSFDEGNEVST